MGFDRLQKKLKKLYNLYKVRNDPTVIKIVDFNWKKNYLARYVPDENTLSNEKQINNSDKIWSCWFQGEASAPDIVKICFRQMKKWHKDVVIITDENISQYIEFPEYIIKKRKNGIIPNAHYSDLIRCYLLAHYGGLWMDATCLQTAEIPQTVIESDFFAFCSTSDKLSGDNTYVCSSWFLYSKTSNQPFYRILWKSLCNYWHNENSLLDYYLFHIFIRIILEKFDLTIKPYFSNVPPHIMQFELFNKYDEKRFNDYLNCSFVHKLTYYDADWRPEDANTNYKHILQVFEKNL